MSNIKNEPPPIASFNDFFLYKSSEEVQKWISLITSAHLQYLCVPKYLLEHFYAMKNALKGTTAQT